jgi:hypothetical protein
MSHINNGENVILCSYINILRNRRKKEKIRGISGIERMFQPGFLCVLHRVRIELFLTARCTEIILLSFVLARELCGFLINIHLADRINGHTIPQVPHFFASGIYPLRRSERVTTVTELAAIASAASSGRNVIPNEG